MELEQALLFVGKWGDGGRLTAENVSPRAAWDALGAATLPDAVALVALDTALTLGLDVTHKWLEMCQNSGDPRVTSHAIIAMREARYRSNKLFSTFGKGWLNRLTDLKREVEALLSS